MALPQATGKSTGLKNALGTLPTKRTLVLERFFDESGGMQLVGHSPFGARVNRALGLAQDPLAAVLSGRAPGGHD